MMAGLHRRLWLLRFLRPSSVGSSSRLCPLRRLHATHKKYNIQPSSAGFSDYDAERKNFRLDIPEYYNFSVNAIDAWAAKEQETPDKVHSPAFWWLGNNGKEVKWNFTELSENSKRVTSMLRQQGLNPGDRVMVMLPKIPEWWLICLGAWRVGLVLLPGTTQLTSKDILHRLHKAQPKCVIADEESAEKMQSVLKDAPTIQTKIMCSKSGAKMAEWHSFTELYNLSAPYQLGQSERTRSTDHMTIFFTSGTTGSPKMTLHSHASYGAAHIISGRYWMDLTQGDVFWQLSDTGWAKAAWFAGPWIIGSCMFITEAPFSAQHTVEILRKFPITTFCAPPTAYRMMALEKLDGIAGSTLSHCLSAGEPLNPEVIDTWKNGTGLWIREGYGQTETVLQCASYRCLPMRPGSMGKPPPGMDLRVIDSDGNEVGVDEEGDVALKVAPERPPGLFLEYLNEPEKTAQCYRGDFYVTGDRGFRDEDGFFWFKSRADDVILSSGYRIGPFEVESALIEHPAVAESAVVSSPHAVRGEIVKAFVILTKDAANVFDKDALVKELQDHVKETTAPYKYPREIEFVTELPKTVSGKIRRVELREKEWAKAK